MYSSTPVSLISPSGWHQSRRWTKRVHETATPSLNQTSQTAVHSSHIHILAQASQDIPPEAIQYAPPLSAYSAEQYGSNFAYSEYNRALQMSALTGVKDGGPKLTPQIQKKLSNLRRIRITGYNTLAPIGINKTMREIEEEARVVEEDDESAGNQVENSVNAGTSAGTETGNVSSALGANLSVDEAPVADLGVLFPEADLDARVPNADSDSDDLLDHTEISVSEALSRSQTHTPDAYMAEDVEYQNDHSLLHDSVTSQRTISGSHASITTGTVVSSVMHSVPSETTYATPTFNARNCEDSDVDMTLE